jgi:hypothetical protein
LIGRTIIKIDKKAPSLGHPTSGVPPKGIVRLPEPLHKDGSITKTDLPSVDSLIVGKEHDARVEALRSKGILALGHNTIR